MGENLSNSGIRAPRLVPYSSSSSNLGKSKNINVDLGQGDCAKDGQKGIKSGIEDWRLNSKKMTTYDRKKIALAKSIKRARVFKHRQRICYNTRVLDEKRKGKKQTSETVCCYRCQDIGHYAFRCTRKSCHDLLVKGTEGSTWNEMWFVNASFKWHVTGNQELFVKSKDNLANMFMHGVGDVNILLNGKMRDISCVSFVPNLDKNVLSMEQLMHQGYEVLKDGDKCKKALLTSN